MISNIKEVISHNKQDKLFCRGYYFTTANVESSAYPFYDNWVKEVFSNGRYNLLVHSKQKYTVHSAENLIYILIGHAYDPIVKELNEANLLKLTVLSGGVTMP